MSNGIEGVYNFLKSNGYDITNDLILDDKPHDYKKDGYKFWYIGTVSSEGVTFTFEDYTKNNGRLHYRSNKHVMYSASHLTRSLESKTDEQELTPNEAFNKIIHEKKALQQKEKKELNQLAAEEAQKIIEKTKHFESSSVLSPYLTKKGFQTKGSGAQLIDENGKVELIIPIQNSNDKTVNIQRIFPDGKKLFLKGGQKKECFHIIDQNTNAPFSENNVTFHNTIYLVEGYATGLSVHLATNSTVIVCFDAGNLKSVSQIIKEITPQISDTDPTYLKFAVACDDDHKNEVNTGLESAKEAVKNILDQGLCAYLCIPDFGGRRKDPDTDWNDLHVASGLDEVRKQLASLQDTNTEILNKPKEFIHRNTEISAHPRINITAPDSYYDLWEKAGLSIGKSKTPLYNYENVLKVFKTYEPLQTLVWYDEFHQKYLTKSTFDGGIREWRDNDDLALTLFFQEHIGFKQISDATISKAVTVFADKNIKNEPKDWMNSLTWDGVNRCEDFFANAAGVTNTEYTKAVGRNWWITLVARIFKPGCKVDNMLILEGPQGAYKSELLKVIAGKWFGEGSESLVNKDFYENLKGKLIYEIGELDQFNKSETTTIKRVITCQVDRYRKAYGRRAEDNPRTCVFVGTTNEDEYLKDSTGGRRFWPILIEKIDVDYVRGAKDQLFAEAVARFKRGEYWWEMPLDETKREQEARRIVDAVEEELVAKIGNKKEVTMRDVVEIVLGASVGNVKHSEQLRLGRALRSIGWKKAKSFRNGVQMKVWINSKFEHDDSAIHNYLKNQSKIQF